MANASRPAGLSPVRYLNGAPWNGAGNVYCIASNDNNAFAIGDPLVLAGSADGNGIATVTLAAAGTGNSVLGPLVSGAGALSYGSSYGVPQESPIVIPATKTRAYYVLVCDDPNVLMSIQEDGLITPLAATDTGTNCNLIAGTNNGYISGWMLDSDSKTTTATLQMKLMGLDQQSVSAGANVFGAYAKWICLINNHCYRIGQVGY